MIIRVIIIKTAENTPGIVAGLCPITNPMTNPGKLISSSTIATMNPRFLNKSTVMIRHILPRYEKTPVSEETGNSIDPN